MTNQVTIEKEPSPIRKGLKYSYPLWIRNARICMASEIENATTEELNALLREAYKQTWIVQAELYRREE